MKGKKDAPVKANPKPVSSGCTRRSFMKKLGVLAGGSSAAAAGLVNPREVLASIAPSREINIGIFGPSHCAAPFVYAKLRGLFKGDNLNVNIVNYPAMPMITIGGNGISAKNAKVNRTPGTSQRSISMIALVKGLIRRWRGVAAGTAGGLGAGTLGPLAVIA